MAWPIWRHTPRVEFHPASAFAAYEVGICAPQTGVFYRFMGIDCDTALGRFGDDPQMMTLHHLAFRAFTCLTPVRMNITQVASVSDIAGLDRFHAACCHQVEARFKLTFVVPNVTGSLVVTNNRHAFCRGISRQLFKVIVGVGLCEAEELAVEEPVAVPADIPAFDEHPFKAMLGSEIDISLGVLGCRAVRCSREATVRSRTDIGAPAFFAQMQRPPDTHVLVWFHPADITKLVGFIQIEFDITHGEASRIRTDADCTPWSMERQVTDRTCCSAAGWRQRGTEIGASGPLHPHPSKIDQLRLMDRNMRAILHPHSERRVDQGHCRDRRFLVEIFIPVPLAAGDPPGGTVCSEVKLGQFFGNPQGFAEAWIIEYISKPYAIIEHAERDAETTLFVAIFLKADSQLIMMIAHKLAFAPWLFPSFIMACGL